MRPPLRNHLTRLIVTLLVAAVAVAARADDATEFARLRQAWMNAHMKQAADEELEIAKRMAAISSRSLAGEHFSSLSCMGMSYLAQGNYLEAIPNFEKAIELARQANPTTRAAQAFKRAAITDGLVSLATCYEQLEQPAQAIAWLEQAIEWDRQNNLADQAVKAITKLADVYIAQGDYARARETYVQGNRMAEQQLTQDPTGMGPRLLVSSLQHNWARLDIEQGRYDRAEPKLKRALKLMIEVTGAESRSVGNMCNTLANLYDKEGRYDEANSLYEYSITCYDKTVGRDHPHAQIVLHSFAHNLRGAGRDVDAEKLLRQIIASQEKHLGADHPFTSGPRMSLGRTLMSLNRLDEAEPVLLQAQKINVQSLGPWHLHTAEANLCVAHIKFVRGQGEQAFELTSHILEGNQLNPLPADLMSEVHEFRAIYLWNTNKKQEALAELRQSLDAAERQRWFSSGAERERASLFSTFIDPFELMVTWQAQLGDAEQTLQAIEAMKARTFLDELALKGVDFLAGLPAEERIKLERRDAELRGALSTAERQLRDLPDPTANDSPQAIAARRKSVGEVQRLQQLVYEHATSMRKSSPAYRQLMAADRPTVSLADVQKSLLGSDELLLLYKFNNSLAYVVAIQPGSATVHELNLEEADAKSLGVPAGPLTAAKLAFVLADLKTGVVPALSRPKTALSKQRELAILWHVLVPKEYRDTLTSGQVKLLTVVPDGALGLLPLEALIVAADEEPQYLLDAGPPIAYAPSVTVLENLARRERVPRGDLEPIFTLGDANYQASQTAAANRGTALLDRKGGERLRGSLARLPATAWESQWVVDHFAKAGMKSVRVIGAEATEAALRRLAPGREIVHLACHGMAEQNHGNFFGSLAMTPGKGGDARDDGFLQMSEIYDLNLTGCELAILSACLTNYGPEQQGEGIWALSRGFLISGSRRVIASNWVVSDEAGATLISYYAALLAKNAASDSNRDYARALQKAKQNVRQTEKWSSPFYWSSLVLVGPK